MTYINCQLPDLETLKERLQDISWVLYYKKFDIRQGPTDSLDYFDEFFKNKNYETTDSNTTVTLLDMGWCNHTEL